LKSPGEDGDGIKFERCSIQMKTSHKRHIITAGESYEDIGYCVAELIRKYGHKLTELYIDCDGVYFTTIEYIK
jgi:hypothetical protein